MLRIRGVSDPTLWLQAKVTKNARLLIGRCRNVDVCLAPDGLQSSLTGNEKTAYSISDKILRARSYRAIDRSRSAREPSSDWPRRWRPTIPQTSCGSLRHRQARTLHSAIDIARSCPASQRENG